MNSVLFQGDVLSHHISFDVNTLIKNALEIHLFIPCHLLCFVGFNGLLLNFAQFMVVSTRYCIELWNVLDVIPVYMSSGTESTTRGFEGCIFRMEIDNVYPLKRAFQDPKPDFVRLYPEGKGTHLMFHFCSRLRPNCHELLPLVLKLKF